MTTKAILAFVLGAIAAAAIVFYTVGQRPAPEPVVQMTTPVTPAEAPQEAVPAGEPQAEPAPAPLAREAERPAPVQRAARESRRASALPPNPSQAPVQTPAQTASAPAQQPSPAPPPQAPPAVEARPQTSEPSPAVAAQNIEARKPEPRVPQTVTIPAGTLITVRLDQALSSTSNDAGDSFRATLDAPLVVDNMVLAERGARVQGKVSEVDPGGRVRGVASLSLELTTLTTSDGQRIRLQTESFARQAEANRKRDVAKVGAAAGIGAAIGAIAGGGKGAAIGAAVGGAAGAGGVMATRGGAAEIAAETRVSFRLAQPVTVTERLK